MHRHVLPDREWNLLAPLLPSRSRTGQAPKDHRTIIDALLWLAKTGRPGAKRFGPCRTVATRFYRWTRSGLWERILAELRRIADAKGKIDWDVHMVDSTSVRAHRCAAGAKGGSIVRRWPLTRWVRQQAAPALRPAWPANGVRPDFRRAERADCPARADEPRRGQALRPRPAAAAAESGRG